MENDKNKLSLTPEELEKITGGINSRTDETLLMLAYGGPKLCCVNRSRGSMEDSNDKDAEKSNEEVNPLIPEDPKDN